MLTQFSRTELLFGKEAMEKLKNSRVAIFGIGGVGGYVCEALVRSGVGAFDLIDDDKVCLTNLNRQIIATRKTVGKYKVDVMKERMEDINPDVDVRVYKCFFLPERCLGLEPVHDEFRRLKSFTAVSRTHDHKDNVVAGQKFSHAVNHGDRLNRRPPASGIMNNASDGIFGHRRVMLEFHGADPRSAHNADETHERPGPRRSGLHGLTFFFRRKVFRADFDFDCQPNLRSQAGKTQLHRPRPPQHRLRPWCRLRPRGCA